jgi:hypothetical protein
MPPQPANMEETIAALAASQYGVITRAQLLGAGISAQTLGRRLKAKRLRSLHRGVYLLGPWMPPHAQPMAAVVACGDSAAVSHGSAAALWELVPGERSAPVEVSVRRGDYRTPGIRVHRIPNLRANEVTTHSSGSRSPRLHERFSIWRSPCRDESWSAQWHTRSTDA